MCIVCVLSNQISKIRLRILSGAALAAPLTAPAPAAERAAPPPAPAPPPLARRLTPLRGRAPPPREPAVLPPASVGSAASAPRAPNQPRQQSDYVFINPTQQQDVSIRPSGITGTLISP